MRSTRPWASTTSPGISSRRYLNEVLPMFAIRIFMGFPVKDGAGILSLSCKRGSGSRWQDAWHPGKAYPGGQTIEVAAERHQIPLFVRAGSSVSLGDLEREYAEARAVAGRRPDLRRWTARSGAGSRRIGRGHQL